MKTGLIAGWFVLLFSCGNEQEGSGGTQDSTTLSPDGNRNPLDSDTATAVDGDGTNSAPDTATSTTTGASGTTTGTSSSYAPYQTKTGSDSRIVTDTTGSRRKQ